MEDKHHSILDLGLGIVQFHPLPRLPLIFITYASRWSEKTEEGKLDRACLAPMQLII